MSKQKMMKTSIVLCVLFLTAIVTARPSNPEADDEYFDFTSFDTHDEREIEQTDYVEM
jgi:hypothetical protein